MSRFDGSYDGSANSFVERKLFIGGLSHNVTEDDLMKYFSTQGPVESVSFSGKSKGHAFVVMERNEDYERILLSDHRLNGRLMNISKTVKMREVKLAADAPKPVSVEGNTSSEPPIQSAPSNEAPKATTMSIDSLLAEVAGADTKVHLSGVSECTIEGMKDYFRHFGEVVDVCKTSPNFAIVTFVKAEDAEKVLHQTIHHVFGKMIQAYKAPDANVSGTKRPLDGYKTPGYHDFGNNAGIFDTNNDIDYYENRSLPKVARYDDWEVSSSTAAAAAAAAYQDPYFAPAPSYSESNTRVPASVAAKHNREGRRLYVGGLQNIPLNDVKEYFEKFGPIEHSEFKHDDYGHFKGFGFISFKSEAVVQAVLSETNHTINGYRLVVNKATQRKTAVKDDDINSESAGSYLDSFKNKPIPYLDETSHAPGSSVYDSQYPVSGLVGGGTAAVYPVEPVVPPVSGIVGDKDYRSVTEVLAQAGALPAVSLAAPALLAGVSAINNDLIPVSDARAYGYSVSPPAVPVTAPSDPNEYYKNYRNPAQFESRDYVPPAVAAARAGYNGEYADSYSGYRQGGLPNQMSRDYIPPHKLAGSIAAPVAQGSGYYAQRDYVPPRQLAASRDYVPPHVLAAGAASLGTQYGSRDYIPPHKLAAAAGVAGSGMGYDNRDYVPPHKLAAAAGIVNPAGVGAASGLGYDSRDYIPPHKLAAVAGVGSQNMGYGSRDYVPPHKLAAAAATTSISYQGGYDSSRDYVPPHKLAAAAGLANGLGYDSRDYIPPSRLAAAAAGMGYQTGFDNTRDYVPPHKLAVAAGIVNGVRGGAMGYECRDYVPPHKMAAAAAATGMGYHAGSDSSRDYVPPHKLAAAAGLVGGGGGHQMPDSVAGSRDYVPPHKMMSMQDRQQDGSNRHW